MIWILASWSGPARGAILRVPQDFGTVRLAYAAAADGDTIRFEPGHYVTSPGEFIPEKRVLLEPVDGEALLAANVPPLNDNFANRTALSGENSVAYTSTFAATPDPGQPPQVQGRTVWWTWTAPTECPVRISTEGSEFAAQIVVFKDVGFSNLGEELLIASGPGQPLELDVSHPGQVFVIAVFGAGGTGGELVLRIRTLAASNDGFAAARSTSGPRVYDKDAMNCGASREPGEPSLGPGAGGRTLWWSWMAPFNSDALVALTDLEPREPRLGVYTGNNVAALEPVPGVYATEDLTNRVFRFRTTAGLVYRVVGDRDTPVAGRLWLRIRQRPPLNIAAVEYLVTNALPSGQFDLTADVTAANTGGADSNPLRLRLLSAAVVPPNTLPTEIHWIQQPLTPPELAPEGTALTRLQTTLPDPGTGTRDAVLVLEESWEDRWLLQDAKNLFTYSRSGILRFNDGINNSGAVLLTPPLVGERWAPWHVRTAQLHVKDVVEGVSNQFWGSVLFTNIYRDAITLPFTNTLWTFLNVPWVTPSLTTNSTNGVFHGGSVMQDTLVTVKAAFRYQSATNEVSASLTVTNLPPPRLSGLPTAASLANGTFGFTLHGVPGRAHRIQVSSSLAVPSSLTIWRDLATNTPAANGTWQFIDTAGRAANAPRFYRVVELP